MNERVRKLREQSVNTEPYVSAERAILITDFYQSEEAKGLSAPMLRANAFKKTLETATL